MHGLSYLLLASHYRIRPCEIDRKAESSFCSRFRIPNDPVLGNVVKKKIIATLYECTRLTDISSIPHILVFTQELEMCKRPSMHLCISRVQVMYCLFDQKGKYPST